MKFKIRKTTKKDISQIVKLFNEVLSKDFPEYQPRVSLIYRKHIFNRKYFLKYFQEKGRVIYAAFHDQQLIGFITTTMEFGGMAHITWFVVSQKHRGLGVGTNLMKKAEKWFLKNKIHNVYLHTEGKKNIEFYKKRGYEYVGLQKEAWFGVDEHIMQKLLHDKPFDEVFEKYMK